jgi:PAS domain S-box-containing protein
MNPEHDAPELSLGAFRTVLDISPHPVLIHDEHVIVYVNNATCRALKADHCDQLVGQPLRSIVHPDGHDAGAERVKMIMEDGHRFEAVPVKLTAVDGETFYAEVAGTRIYDQGKPYVLVTPVMNGGAQLP